MTNTRNIPRELKKMKRWVCVKDSSSKRPVCAIDGSWASVTDSSTWCGYKDALACLRAGKCAYLGFVFADDGIVGIDIDHSLDECGFLKDEVLEAVEACDSYTEVSKSGEGIHILVKASLPFKGSNNRAGWEIYRTGRYFLLTGAVLGTTEIREAQDAVDLIVADHFSDVPEKENGRKRNSLIWEPTWGEVNGTTVPLSADYPPVGPGARHLSMVSFCGQMHTAGASPEVVRNMAHVANRRFFIPPLDDEEIDQIVASCTRRRR